MNLSYYDSSKFPLLLDLYKQSCETSALLSAEYTKNGGDNTLKQLKMSICNSVEIYNKILTLYNEKGCNDYVKSDYFDRTIGKRPGAQTGRSGHDPGCELHACG